MDRIHRPLVTVFGASGFVGTLVVQALAKRGFRVRAAVRRPDLAGHLGPLGMLGQIACVQANIRNTASVARACEQAAVVVNLVGIGFERGPQRFEAVNTEGARTVAAAARAAGAETLVHVSGLGFSPDDSASPFARSKAAGEVAVREAFPGATIFRPSIMFGRGDGFFTPLASLSRFVPAMPLIGGTSRFQPVYVGDVALAIAAAAEGKVRPGAVWELGGPQIETHRQLLERILREIGRRKPIVPVPLGVGRLMASVLGMLPTPLLTRDQVSLLAADNVVSENALREKRTFSGLGIVPTAMDTILPTYLWRFRKNGQFDNQTNAGVTE